jgi:hypothetical protein
MVGMHARSSLTHATFLYVGSASGVQERNSVRFLGDWGAEEKRR